MAALRPIDGLSRSNTRRLLAGAFLVPVSSGFCAECKAGRVLDESQKAVVMSISIPPGDFAPRSLICMTERLRSRYEGRQEMVDSHAAAKHSLPMTVEWDPTRNEWNSHVHASYYYDAEKKQERSFCCQIRSTGT